MAGKLPRTDHCPIARSLNRVGEWWSMLILRESFYGAKRFDEFQNNLDIASNMLSTRLAGLVEEGLLERSQYCFKPPRYEYLLTQRGLDFRPVILTLVDWGNKHFAQEGVSALVVDRETNRPVDLVLVDRNTGKQITIAGHAVVPGPAASESMRSRLARAVEPHTVNHLILPATHEDSAKSREKSKTPAVPVASCEQMGRPLKQTRQSVAKAFGESNSSPTAAKSVSKRTVKR